MTVAVITDSVACLSPKLRSRLGIGMVGITIIVDGTAYQESVDLTAEEFYDRMDETISHRTASPSVGDWLEVMQPAVDAGADGLLVVTLAAPLSSTFDSARAAVELVDVPAVAVDSATAAAAEGLFVRRLAEEAADGASLEILADRARRRRGSYHLEFVLEGLRRLAHSGRMPETMARLGDAVELKPMLTLGREGDVRLSGAVRGVERGIERIRRRVLVTFSREALGRVVVTHALREHDALGLAEQLRADRPRLEVETAVFSPVMGASTGPIIGVAWEDPRLMSQEAEPGQATSNP